MNNNNKILMKHKDLVNAKYESKLIHNKIFVYLLYTFQKHTDKDKLIHEISREELLSLVLKQNDRTIKGLKKLLSDLRQKELFLVDERDDGSLDYITAGFIDKFSYNDKADTFTIYADSHVHRLLHKYLNDGYTPINLKIWLELKNSYSQRFYDLLRAWSGTKEVINYKLDYIRKVLFLENKYKVYSDFKKRVLLPAINELNETGYFEIEFKEVRKGRKIDSIDFIVKDFDKRKYFNQTALNNKNKEKFDLLEHLYNQTSTKLLETNKSQLKTESTSFYIPDETIFTKGTLRSFKLDFKNIDFRNQYMKKSFDYAVMITLDRDNVDKIKYNSYKFFKGTLDNKIIEYKKEEEEDIKYKKEIDEFW